MKFYTKLSDCSSGSLYKFLLVMRFIVIFLMVVTTQAKANTYGQHFISNHRNILTKIAPVKDSVIFVGQITDEKGKFMAGATVKLLGSKKSTFSNVNGYFGIYAPLKETIEISYIGYQTKQITLSGLDPKKHINVTLSQGNNNLGEVSIVSNGYQDIPKERSTGSFEQITKEQLQHSSDPNLIRRLEGITTSLDFNNNLVPINSADPNTIGLSGQKASSPLTNLTIRGKNTLNQAGQVEAGNSSGQVLVVIDGVASPYSIDNVDPNDVESITILKDAAAASIWGSRAANGVIIVKTKRGQYNKPISVSFNANFNVTDKLDLFYHKTMSTSDYIDAQVFLYNKSGISLGAPDVIRPQRFASPVAEILASQQRGEITSDQVSAQLDAFRGNDIRQDYNKYLLRDAFTQSYSLGIDGGSKNVSWRVFGGYNKTLNNTINSQGDRWNLGYSTYFKPFKNLEVNVNIVYSQLGTENQSSNNIISALVGAPFYPYTKFTDSQGNPAVMPYKYRPAFINLLSSTYGSKIQDLTYNPLQNINEGYTNSSAKNLNFNVGANYKINDIISASLLYNYTMGNNLQETLDSKNSFYVRDLVTTFTLPVGTQQIPLGAIYQPRTINTDYYSVRGQLNATKNWGAKHALNAITGMEVTDSYSLTKNFQYFGYNEENLMSNNSLNFGSNLSTLFKNQNTASSIARIPTVGSSFVDAKTRTISYYVNAAYTYNNRYTISASARKDMSSDFGQGTNNKGTPFYSFGGSWNIAQEDFYKVSWLPKLQLRSTFGYNGNVNPTVIARAQIFYSFGPQDNGLLSASPFGNPTNNELRPERTGVLNLGLDFGMKNNWLTGSLEYYRKQTKDLISSNTIDPSTGYPNAYFNTANLLGQGVDFTLNSLNIHSGAFTWNSNFLFSYNRVKVKKLFTPSALSAEDVIANSFYNEGYDLTRIFAYKWAGLDPKTGDPRGYDVNGQPVSIKNVGSYNIVAFQPLASARYFGSAVPVYYGSFRNTLRYKSVSLSANLLYKFGYYIRRPSSDMVNYSTLFANANTIQGAEYAQRWQKPGDELSTNVPSAVYPADSWRDKFYQYSEINVIKGDHIRLQEVNVSYNFVGNKWILKNPRLYANISNLGVIWRANKLGIDPEVNDYPQPKTYSLGFSANF